MMFCQPPRIPLDLIFPMVNTDTHEKGLISDAAAQSYLTILNNDDENNWRKKVKPEIQDYCNSQMRAFKLMHNMAAKNRDITMDRAKIRHDRQIKKFDYNIGDLVLTDHVKLKQGMCSGLAHKYFGPFVVVGKHPNKVNYIIRKVKSNKSKRFLIHKNRLKLYFGHYEEYLNNNFAGDDSALTRNTSLNFNRKKKIQKVTPTIVVGSSQRESNDGVLNEPERFLQSQLLESALQSSGSTDNAITVLNQEPRNDHVNTHLANRGSQPTEAASEDIQLPNYSVEVEKLNDDETDRSFRPYYRKTTNRRYKSKLRINETDMLGKRKKRFTTRNAVIDNQFEISWTRSEWDELIRFKPVKSIDGSISGYAKRSEDGSEMGSLIMLGKSDWVNIKMVDHFSDSSSIVLVNKDEI
ncbi:hypothetical protein BpHYR1_052607 [Brachionus plicatilis]|uniref:Uncharacterized protein n=1 Tax=Brachionus plicatilis TaxID=10195 RepID=A0A3M7R8H5_BRAPC|nr:hypothetical protein BpHYR1_052607 [Brachionus plicatilis]